MSARYMACKHCGLDIEGAFPYRKGEWRDRGNNTVCPHGPNKDSKHTPYREPTWRHELKAIAKGKT